jgi:cytochrome c-type biogenesis protein CcmH/NrfG
MVYDEMHADDQAIAAFSKAMAVSPGDTRSKFQRGQAYLHKGDLANARRDLEDVVKSADPQLTTERPIAAQLLIQLARKPQRDTPKSPDCRLHGKCLVDDDVVGDPR